MATGRKLTQAKVQLAAELRAAGVSYEKIAAQLGVSRKTVVRELCPEQREKTYEGNREWRARNLEKARARAREYARENKEAVARQSKEWAQKNPEKKRQWYLNNKEKHRALVTAWDRAHPDAKRVHRFRRRGRALAAETDNHTAAELKAHLKAWHGLCAYCFEPTEGNLAVDHVVPLSLGGANTLANLVPACRFCNGSKGSKSLTEWGRLPWSPREPF